MISSKDIGTYSQYLPSTRKIEIGYKSSQFLDLTVGNGGIGKYNLSHVSMNFKKDSVEYWVNDGGCIGYPAKSGNIYFFQASYSSECGFVPYAYFPYGNSTDSTLSLSLSRIGNSQNDLFLRSILLETDNVSYFENSIFMNIFKAGSPVFGVKTIEVDCSMNIYNNL